VSSQGSRNRRRGAIACLAVSLAATTCGSPRGIPERLRILAPYLPETIDPVADSRLVSRMVVVNVFEPLVRSGETGEPVPALAASWTNPGPDTWRFRLRAGARFSDGTPVTAEDVVRSVERARRPESVIAGNLAALREVRADGPGVVTMSAARGATAFLATLTSVLVAREAPPGSGGGGFLGSGPYEVTAFVPGKRIVMRAFGPRSRPGPRVEEAAWEPFGPPEGARERLASDPRTIVLDPAREAVEAARGDRRYAVTAAFNGALAYLAFGLAPRADGAPRPFADRRVREAVHRAVDVPALIAVLGPAGGYPATQVIPSGVFGHDGAIPFHGRDVPAARALLREAGAEGRRVVLDTTEMNARVARAIAAQLGEAGLAVEVRVLPSSEFLSFIDGGSDLFLFSWVVGPDAGEALRNFFHTRDAARQLGARNRTGFSSAEFDEVIAEALRIAEPSEKLPALQRAVRVLDRELPWVPLYTIRSVRIHPAGLVLRNRIDSMLLLADIGAKE
jgi:peptide/nickel transport system substrate-binding protein